MYSIHILFFCCYNLLCRIALNTAHDITNLKLQRCFITTGNKLYDALNVGTETVVSTCNIVLQYSHLLTWVVLLTTEWPYIHYYIGSRYNKQGLLELTLLTFQVGCRYEFCQGYFKIGGGGNLIINFCFDRLRIILRIALELWFFIFITNGSIS
jgi:hypothetical protein